MVIENVGSSVAAVPWGWARGAAVSPTAGLSSMAVLECCAWESLCLSLEKGAASALAETTLLNILLLLPVLNAAQPSLLFLDLSFPELFQVMRGAPDETMVCCV